MHNDFSTNILRDREKGWNKWMNEWENSASLVYLLMLGITSSFLLISEGRYLISWILTFVGQSWGQGLDPGGSEILVVPWVGSIRRPTKEVNIAGLKVWGSERKTGIWVGKCPGRRAVTTGALGERLRMKSQGQLRWNREQGWTMGKRRVGDGTEKRRCRLGKHESETWKNQGVKPWNLNLLRFTGEKQ